MKITIDNSVKSKKFRDLNVGDVFMIAQNEVYMRIPDVVDRGDRNANAISLRDGMLHYFAQMEFVSERKSELIIGEEIR